MGVVDFNCINQTLWWCRINSERLTIGADNSLVEIVSVDTVKINVLHSGFNLVQLLLK